MRTDAEIERAIRAVDKILRKKVIYLHCNSEVREGYRKARDILNSRTTDISISGINLLNSITSKSIAKLAIDYLNELITLKVLISIKIRNY